MMKPTSDIAIIGMAATFAGAPDLATYWGNIVGKVDAVREAPEAWSYPYFDPESRSNDRIYTRMGGFLGDLAQFDPTQFGIMPNAVDGGEPDQYLALKLATAALKDAGYDERPFNRKTTGVVLGRGTYVNRGYTNLMQHGMMVDQTLDVLHSILPDLGSDALDVLRTQLKQSLPPFTAEMSPGLVPNVVSGRIANRLDLMGPNFIVDAACASSLIAVELAIRELASGRCDMVLTGGVHASTPPQIYMIFCQLQALSRGRIRPFAKGADGVLLGEGAGILLLKRLDDARRDADRIYAVIKGVGSASDGKALGLLAPRLDGEILGLTRAYNSAAVDPRSVELLEAHGTAIPLGDKTEIEAMKLVFGDRDGGCPRCAIGSVKSMIGHCIPAAGAAALVKTALALYHKVLPPTLCEEVNPALEIERTRLYVNTDARPWIHGDCATPRRAGVNAFGFGGINAHAILEEYREQPPTALMHDRWSTELLVFSADTLAGLVECVDRVLAFLGRNADTAIANVAATLAVRPPMRHRLAIVASTVSDLVAKAAAVKERLQRDVTERIQARNGIYYAHESMRGKTAFLFPGEGSQHANMLADLCIHLPPVRSWFDFLDSIFHERDLPPSAIIFPPPTSLTDVERQRLEERLFEMDLGSEAVFTASMALNELLGECGVRCDAMVGHSTGENTALVASGMLHCADREALADRMRQFNRIYEELKKNSRIPHGALLAVGALDRDALEAEIVQAKANLFIAVDNCPNQAVLFGEAEAIGQLAARLGANGAICSPLAMDRAYHTPLFARVADAFRTFYGSLDLRAGHTPVWSCTALAFFPRDADAICEMAGSQWSMQVRFRETIEQLFAQGFRTFVEVGPAGNLSAFVSDTLGKREHLALSSNSRRQSGLAALQHLLARLFVNGCDVTLNPLFKWRRTRLLDFGAPAVDRPPVVQHRLELDPPRLKIASEQALQWQTQIAAPRTGRLATLSGPSDIREVATGNDASDPYGAALQAHFALMQEFLASQARVLDRYAQYEDTGGSVVEPASLPLTESSNRFPLLGRISKLTPTELTCERRFDLHRDLFLRDHTLGGRPSHVDHDLCALAILPFTFSMELIAEAASLLAGEERIVVGIRDVRGYRWIALDDETVDLQIHATLDAKALGDDSRDVRVAVREMDRSGTTGTLVFEGTVSMSTATREPPALFRLGDEQCRDSSFRDDELYTRGMFHGPSLQGVSHIRQWSPNGIDADLAILETASNFSFTRSPLFRIGPGLLDAAGQLVGYWLSEQFGSDFNCFPFRLASLERYAPSLPAGTPIRCCALIRVVGGERLLADFDLVGPDDKVVARMRGWEDRYFRVPSRVYESRLDPRRAFLSEPCEIGEAEVVCRRIDPVREGFFEEAGSIWSRVLAHLVLSRREREQWKTIRGSDARRTEWLLGRIAVKDAVRIWARDRLGQLVAPADVEIRAAEDGEPRVACEPLGERVPHISIAHSEGRVVAVATGSGRVGIDLVCPGRAVAHELRSAGFGPAEHELLERAAAQLGDQTVLAMWAAKEAAAKALGSGLAGGPLRWVVTEYDAEQSRARVSHGGRTVSVRIICDEDEIKALCVESAEAAGEHPLASHLERGHSHFHYGEYEHL